MVSNTRAITVKEDSWVHAWGSDSYLEGYSAVVIDPDGNRFQVGYRADDQNIYTEATTFTYFVPAGWSTALESELMPAYRVIPTGIKTLKQRLMIKYL